MHIRMYIGMKFFVHVYLYAYIINNLFYIYTCIWKCKNIVRHLKMLHAILLIVTHLILGGSLNEFGNVSCPDPNSANYTSNKALHVSYRIWPHEIKTYVLCDHESILAVDYLHTQVC